MARGGVRAGRGRDGLRRRGGGGRSRQRHRVRAVRVDLHPRPGPGPARLARGRGRQPQRELALQRAGTGRPSAGSSSRGSAASSGPTPRTPSPRRRTSSSPTRGLEAASYDLPKEVAGRIEGKVAVVTGGCSGIGLATVRRFVEEGARVVIGDLNLTRGAEIVEELGGPAVATFVEVDVTDKDQVDGLFRTAQGHLRLGRHRLQQRRHQPSRGRLDPATPTSRPGTWCSGST